MTDEDNQSMAPSVYIRSDLKIVVIGACGSGKTSIVNRYTKKIFSNDYKATIAAEFGYKVVEYKNNHYRIQLWDIGGQNSSASMTRIFAKDSHGCLVVTDITKLDGDEQTALWKKEMDEIQFLDGGHVPCILLANKSDLIEEFEDEREDYCEKLEKIRNENSFENYFITSAKEDQGIDEAMKFLIENIVDRIERNGSEGFANGNSRETIKLEGRRHTVNATCEKKKQEKEKGCC